MFISRRVSKSIIKVNDSAKKLSKGDFNIRFSGHDYKEISELSDTLNYTAEELGKTEFQEIIIRVSSERLDSIVSELVNISRNSASEAIESGNIMLNYVTQKRKDKNVDISDIITIRQHGKFIFAENLGMTKKGKKKLLFKKYI